MKIKLIILFVFYFYLQAFTQNKTINGYIKDSISSESLIGATLNVDGTNYGVVTNTYGYYSLTFPMAQEATIIAQYLGYKTKKIVVNSNTAVENIDLYLSEETTSLGEVNVLAKAENQNISQTKMSTIDLPIKDIKSMAMIVGERDVLKSIQFLPGVQSGNEGTTGFFVRGGNIDQNLVLLDEATVYNPNHLFGLFSTFNVNSLNNVTLIKGGFPAQYGGRLSSILDISMRDGNKSKSVVEGGIGLLSSNLTIEGPLQKSKSSYIISGRRSYADILAKPFAGANQTLYYLYDVNAKINFDLGKKDKLFLSFFKGLDNANYTGANSLNYGINFGNTTSTLRWNHIAGSKAFLNTSFIINKYHLGLSTTQNKYYALLYTGINDLNVKHSIDWFPNTKHNIKTGVQYIYHGLSPASVSAKIPKKGDKIKLKPDSLDVFYSNELSYFINDEYLVSDNFGINAGLRLPYFFNKNSSYFLYEPRLSLRYTLNENTSIKAAYTEMNQFLHLVPNSTASLPTDIWINSSNVVKPQNSKQLALGLFKNFNENTLETSMEVYYKDMSNQVLFKEGTQLSVKSDIEQQLTFGKGKSYGVEFFIRKSSGKVNGWISYTLSKTTQTFSELNKGQSFPFTYDRTHVLNVVGNYNLSPKWSLSANFVFNTGAAYTLPAGKVPVFNGGTLYDTYYSDYADRNNYRLNAYHRLDVGATYKKQRKIFGKKYDSEWVFSLYNVYSRQNPYFVYLTTDAVTKQPKAKQVSLLPIIPGVAYNFKF